VSHDQEQDAKDTKSTARLDKWLWAVRVFKSRSMAADACRAGSVHVNEHLVKPSRELRPGDTLVVRLGLIHRTLVVMAFPKGRVSAKQVPDFCDDKTPPEEYEKARQQRVQQLLAREKGSGRPTKRDRRMIEHLFE
jgi:ribosome-associated heat shock protein Hsp15